MDKVDFINLLKKLTEAQYDCDLNIDEEEFHETVFSSIGTLDLTKSTYIEVKSAVNAIKNSNRITIGKFSININSAGNNVNIQIFENKDKYFGGHRKTMPEKVNMKKDTRFNTQEWITYFKNPLIGGSNIPLEVVVDIVKWIQVVYKFPAFL